MKQHMHNKFIQRYLGERARMVSPQEQLLDTMHRLLERSNPDILEVQKRYEIVRVANF